jgi:fibronectin-binding autotransporter adhesin
MTKHCIAFPLLSLLGASPLFSQTLWNVASGADWDVGANWSTNPTVPNTIGADARITNLTTAGAYTINASSAQTFTVGRLDFGSNLAGAAVDLDMTIGSNVGLVFDVASGNAQLNFGTGGTGSTMVINSAIQLNDNLTSTSVRNGGTQIAPQFTGAINLQGNTWTVTNNQQGMRFDGLISGAGAMAIANDSGSQRTTTFNNTASTFSGGLTVGRANTIQLGSGTTTSGTGGGGILGTGLITTGSGSTTNDGNAATLQSNGAFPTNDSDSAANAFANNIEVASGRFLRIDTPRVLNYTGTLSGSGTILKTAGNGSGSRAFAINVANTGFTGTVEIQDGQLNTRVTNALGSSATIRFNPTSNTNGVGLFGSTTSGTDVAIGSTLQFQRTASGNSQFITTAGNSTFTLSGNFSNTGTGTAGYIGLGRGNGVVTNVGGGFSLGSNTGTATISLTGNGSLENNIGIVNGSSTASVLSLGNTAGDQTFSGNITGNGALVRNGLGGTSTLSGTNTYTGTTTISAGTLSLSGSGSLANTSSVTLTGGTLLLGASDRINNGAGFTTSGGGKIQISGTSNFTETVGSLSLGAGNSVIDFGSLSGTNVLTFAASSLTGTGTLQVWNWSGNVAAGNGTDQLFFGNSASGLTGGTSASVEFFTGPGSGSLGVGSQLPTGELVPVPEPSGLLAALGLLGLTFRRDGRNRHRSV